MRKGIASSPRGEVSRTQRRAGVHQSSSGGEPPRRWASNPVSIRSFTTDRGHPLTHVDEEFVERNKRAHREVALRDQRDPERDDEQL